VIVGGLARKDQLRKAVFTRRRMHQCEGRSHNCLLKHQPKTPATRLGGSRSD
jgi:hypothetical protein